MRYDGIVLYGSPASGKDTVTRELERLDSRYVLFDKLKTGDGRTDGYRMTDAPTLGRMRSSGLIIHEVHRYDATYAVDSPRLDQLLEQRRIPVIHMGQVEGVRAITSHEGRWLAILLRCSREVAEERLKCRDESDVGRRLSVWDTVDDDLRRETASVFQATIRTDETSPGQVAMAIDRRIKTVAP